MKTDKGTLKKAKKGFRVSLPSKKGSAEHPIPDAAVFFRIDDAEDGLEVDVTRDQKNRIIKVVIPGKAEVSPTPPRSESSRQGGKHGKSGRQNKNFRTQSQPQAVRHLAKATPAVLGSGFHNPYTFLRFGDGGKRDDPSPLSIDELESEQGKRFTGVLTLKVRTESPLLTCAPTAISGEAGEHKTYEALTIGDDVIVPSTGIRGALRTLMTIITGGTLGYLNESTYLVQGRDANLGPRGIKSPPHTPKNVFLAQVETQGTSTHAGRVRLGHTKLIRLKSLEACQGGRKLNRRPGSEYWVRLDEKDEPAEVTKGKKDQTDWRLKLSGRPINMRGKREGVFKPGETAIDLPRTFWEAYSGRNAHGDRPELRKGDLVWLEPKDPEAKEILSADDVASIQWSRWGKKGQPLQEQIPQEVHPDYLIGDGRVDEVTNLFGQLDANTDGAVDAFAARVRPENLVFLDAKPKVTRTTLAPLAPPHPGCIAFYRDCDNPDEISQSFKVKGYKVYRTTKERGDDAPWLYKNQGVYGDKGELKDPKQKVNKTCDLLNEGLEGTLRISFRALSERELALLMLTCQIPWRVGGGKPLGLGACSVSIQDLIDEDGERLQVPGWSMAEQDGKLAVSGWEEKVDDLDSRVQLWVASQQPVDKLRYPRAVDDNRNKKSRGGHAWFMRHAKPRMVTQKGDGAREPGLEPLYIDGPMKDKAKSSGVEIDEGTPMVAGQALPAFQPDSPDEDVLYGYDVINTKTRDEQRPRRRVFLSVEPFDPSKHVTGKEETGGSHGKDRDFRQGQKKRK